MAKLGLIHYNLPRDFSFEQFLKYAADTGFQYVELMLTDVWPDGEQNPEASAARVKQQVKAHGLRVSAVGAGNDLIQPDEERKRQQVERTARVARLARILDDEAVVRSEGGQPKDSMPQEQWLGSMVDCFSRLAPLVEGEKVGIAIDNHGYVTNDGELLYQVIRRVDHPLIGTNLDTMNYRWYGNDLATCSRYYEMMAPHTLHTHLKDGFDSRQNYRGAALGEGEINLQHALDCLQRAGYKGAYCAEYEGPEVAGGTGYRKCLDWMLKHVR